MTPIQLDMSRLFGFKIVAAELAAQPGPLQVGTKLGQKEGEKLPAPLAGIGPKVGEKAPPPAPFSLGTKIGVKVGEKVN